MLAPILAGLRDIQGVVGSFVVDDHGGLVAADLPAFFDTHALALAAPRLRRLADALTSQGHALKQATLHFANHRLWLQPEPGLLLCVVAPAECNFAALRMGANLVARRLRTHVAAPWNAGIPVPVPVEPSTESISPSLGSTLVDEGAARSGTHGTPPAARSSGSWLRSRVPGASASSSGRRQFRGRPIDDDGAR